MKTCYACGKVGNVARDQTAPPEDEMAVDARLLVCRYTPEWVCGECLDRAEDAAYAASFRAASNPEE